MSLSELVAAELAEPVDPRVSAMAAAIAAAHPGTLGVIFYGSCLRDETLSGMLDFYVIVEDYRRAYSKSWLARVNALLPPNVFPFAQGDLAAKYAVLSIADLERETGPEARDTSTFARLSQPVRLVWSQSAETTHKIAEMIAQAPPTLLGRAVVLLPNDQRGMLALWRKAFELTYSAELRAERAGRGISIVDADPAFYRRVARLSFLKQPWMRSAPWDVAEIAAAENWWRKARRVGKFRQVLKLAKASFTFAGGVDYLAWKINRHAGTKIEIKPWQRRWPLLGAFVLVPRLILQGAVR